MNKVDVARQSRPPPTAYKTTATSGRSAGGRMVEKKDHCNKGWGFWEGRCRPRVVGLQWWRVTAARCRGHTPNPISSCFPRIEIGALEEKNSETKRIQASTLDNAKIKKLNAWIASLTMSTSKIQDTN